MRKTQAATFALVIGAVFSAACKKGPASSPARSSTAPVDLSMPVSHAPAGAPDDAAKKKIQAEKDEELNRLIEKKYAGNPAEKEAVLRDAARLNALDDAEKKWSEIHRRTMITAAPADFKPEAAARKVRLRLFLEKSRIRVGEDLRFRLEMMNVGRQAIDYEEYKPSLFVKNAGSTDSDVMTLYITDPKGKRRRATGTRGWGGGATNKPEVFETLPDSMSQADKEKWLAETSAMSEASTHFKIRLMPGETLHSIGDSDSPRDNFRTLHTEHEYDELGTYKLQVDLDDRPEALDKDYIEFSLRIGSTLKQIRENHDRRKKNALGPVSSNPATYEVTR